MSTGTRITADDLEAVAGTLNDTRLGPSAWLESEGIEEGAMAHVLTAGVRAFVKGMTRDGADLDGVLCDLIGNAFRLGFACGAKFGGHDG